MVYAEQLTSATYLDKRAEVEPYLLAMERLSVVSAPRRVQRISSATSWWTWRGLMSTNHNGMPATELGR